MKRTILAFISLFLLICIVSCTTEKAGNEDISKGESDAQTGDASVALRSDGEEIEAPATDILKVLEFGTFEAYLEFKNSIDKSDKEFQEYVSRTYLGDVEQKSDVADIFKYFGDWELVYLKPESGYEIDTVILNIYVRPNSIQVCYTKGNEHLWVSSCYNSEIGSNEYTDEIAILSVFNKPLKLYEGASYNFDGRLYTEKHSLYFRFMKDTPEEVEALLNEYATIITLNELGTEQDRSLN